MTTHRKSLLFFCVLLATLAGPASAHAAALAQDQPWQVTLRNWMATLKAEDFRIAPAAFEMRKDLDNLGDEELFRAWIGLAGAAASKSPKPTSLLYPANHFTLSAIEAGETVRLWHESEEAAWWVAFAEPENPYKNLRPAKLRAAVMAAVNMIMFDTVYQAEGFDRRADGLAENLHAWTYVYLQVRDALPAEVQQAYLAGVMRQFERMEKIAPRDVNTNMDTREIIVLALMDEIYAGDAAMHRRIIDDARRILFGDASRGPANSDGKKGMFHPAGYVGETDGPEASYNGISLYHLVEAAMITRGQPDWDAFMPEVIDRMLKFKAHQTYPEPDGRWVGPSNWAKRTSDGYPSDQRARLWREAAAAMLSENGVYLLRNASPPNTAGPLATGDELRADIARSVRALNAAFSKPIQAEPPSFKKSVYDWPSDLVYAWDHYVPGSYVRFARLASAGSSLLKPPFARQGNINLCFNGEFWIAKQGRWGFQVESVPDMGWGYDNNGSGALAGGSLACFWTGDAGSVLLGRLPDKWNGVTWDKIENWTTHHLWGRTAAGKPFSSARQRKPSVKYDDLDSPHQVTVGGSLDGKRTAPDDALEGPTAYRRTFRMTDQGLHVTTEFTCDGGGRIKELWESLPVFLRHGQKQKAIADARIDFQANGAWQPASAQPRAAVTAVRITRFGHSALIVFDTPQRVLLSAEPYEVAYQGKTRFRMLKIDLLGGAGESAMPRKATVGYLLRPATPAETPPAPER